MLKDLSLDKQVYIVTGYTDLRRSIDGLAMIVKAQLQLDPYSTALFLFCGRRCDRIKGLLWEGDGFLLLYKRLDNGRFQWPRNETEDSLSSVSLKKNTYIIAIVILSNTWYNSGSFIVGVRRYGY